MRLVKEAALFIAAIFFVSRVFSAPVVQFTDEGQVQKIGRQLWLFEDSTGKMNALQVLQRGGFYLSANEVPNLGVTKATFWAKITLINKTATERLLLDLAQPTLNDVAVYRVFDSTHVSEIYNSGNEMRFEHRTYNHQNYLVDLDVPAGKEQVYLLRVRGSDQVMLPLTLGVPRQIMETTTRKDMIFGIFFGLMMVMFLYNLFIYFTVRDKSYIYYVLYILLVCMLQATLQGYTFRFLWPGNTWLAKNTVFLLPSLAGLSAMIFAREFLQAKLIVPKLNKVLSVLIGIFCVAIVLLLAGNFQASFTVMQLNTILGSLFVLFLSYIVSTKGNRSAKFFLIAWTILLVGATIFVLKDFGILPFNTLTNSILEIGTAAEAVLLSFALADKINIFRKEKEESQAQALAALKENERIIKEQNVILESKVTERTQELNVANKELNTALTDLKGAQTQLVESEKMASLGQLTAGIAHEINNPINFVTSNVKPLNRDFRLLIEAIESIEGVVAGNGGQIEKVQRIEAIKEEIDYDYLKMEINQLLTGIGEGANRTAEIVKGLRIFSRLDEDDLKKADVNEGLESTLIIANNLLSHIIGVSKQYGNIPLVECYPGKLNQVFLNIISNAIYAIKKKFGDKPGGLLSIGTSHDESNVYISLKDNGTGMDEQTQKRLYEPFFTTKDVGEGTGLGLSIAYNTIVKHNGQIRVISEIGVGTEFILTLPLVQK